MFLFLLLLTFKTDNDDFSLTLYLSMLFQSSSRLLLSEVLAVSVTDHLVHDLGMGSRKKRAKA